jgi:hypothetical protein
MAVAPTPPGVLRRVALPPGLPGALWLAGMPGRHAPLAGFLDAAAAAGIGHLLCLTALPEVAATSPDYAAALVAGTLPFAVHPHPIEDFATPADPGAFAAWTQRMAAKLRGGEHLALHCAAGIGRTGMVALCLLRACGLDAAAAAALVTAAGSHPETPAQRAFAAGFVPLA